EQAVATCGARPWILLAPAGEMGRLHLRGAPQTSGSRSESHAAWSPRGLEGGFLANVSGSCGAQRILWLFHRAMRGQTTKEFSRQPRGMPDATTERGERSFHLREPGRRHPLTTSR